MIKESRPKIDLANIGHIIAIAAGKGGVGKSTVAVCLALALNKQGLKVGLLDADVYGPSLEQMLPMGMEPSEHQEDPERVLPALACGIATISMAQFQHEASIVRAPIANKMIEQFLGKVDWGPLDYLIIDFPPGTGDIQLTLMQKAPIAAAIVITTPQTVATIDVKMAAELFLKMHVPVLGVLENMSYFTDPGGTRHFPFGEGGGEELSKAFEMPLLGQLPLDPMISKVGDQGQSLFEQAPDSPSAKFFQALAKDLNARIQKLPIVEGGIRLQNSQKLEVRVKGKWRPLGALQVQMACPCAKCTKKGEKKNSHPDVSILELSSVGRYAVRFTFSIGCSQGIYPLRSLMVMANK